MLRLVSWALIIAILSTPLSTPFALTNPSDLSSPDGSSSPERASSLIVAAEAPINLALGKPATQSSLYGTGAASYAVDGNTSGSITHTQSNAQAWWQVDLGGVRPIGTIAVWNHTGCCLDRLKNVSSQ